MSRWKHLLFYLTSKPVSFLFFPSPPSHVSIISVFSRIIYIFKQTETLLQLTSLIPITNIYFTKVFFVYLPFYGDETCWKYSVTERFIILLYFRFLAILFISDTSCTPGTILAAPSLSFSSSILLKIAATYYHIIKPLSLKKQSRI